MNDIVLVEVFQGFKQLSDDVDDFAFLEHGFIGNLLFEVATLHEFLNHIVEILVLENLENSYDVGVVCLWQNNQFVF